MSKPTLSCQIIQYGILHFQCKCKHQEKRHNNCYYFLPSVLILLDKYPFSVFQRNCHHLVIDSKSSINQKKIIDFSNFDCSKLMLCLNPISFFVGQKEVCKKWCSVRSHCSAGNNILNPDGHHDQIIPLFGGHFKFRAVSWCMPKNPVGHHGWEIKKILQFRSSKTAFSAIFHNIIFKNIASVFF